MGWNHWLLCSRRRRQEILWVMVRQRRIERKFFEKRGLAALKKQRKKQYRIRLTRLNKGRPKRSWNDEIYKISPIIRREKSRKGPSICDVRTEGGVGVKKCSKFADEQYRLWRQRGGRGPKSPKLMWTYYMKAPKGICIQLRGTMWTDCWVEGSRRDQRFRQKKKHSTFLTNPLITLLCWGEREVRECRSEVRFIN